MDWQEIAALGVVAVTGGLFIRAKLRRRKFNFERGTHCGCAAGGTERHNSIIFSARKGGRPKIIMKAS